MDKENIENQSPVGLSAVSGPSVGHTVEVPSSSLQDIGLGQENEDRSGLEEAGSKSRVKITIRSWSGVAVWKWLAYDGNAATAEYLLTDAVPVVNLPEEIVPWSVSFH